jgi:hypothetical protein
MGLLFCCHHEILGSHDLSSCVLDAFESIALVIRVANNCKSRWITLVVRR